MNPKNIQLTSDPKNPNVIHKQLLTHDPITQPGYLLGPFIMSVDPLCNDSLH
jgi:hypothetical protein